MKKKTDAQLKKELDKVFSLYVRTKYAQNGLVRCYTCSVSKPIKSIQNGHWIPRNILATRFDEKNCRPQCVACNLFQRGRPDVFAMGLLKEYGRKGLEALQAQRHAIIRYFPYEEKIAEYKEKLAKLQ